MQPHRDGTGEDSMAYDSRLREEEIKNKVASDVFGAFDCTRIFGSVDFCVAVKVDGPALWEPESLLWAEAKNGRHDDLAPLFAQLVLTLGKARTFDDHLPPPFLGAFDAEKIAFIPYHKLVDLFYQNDFNWNVAPSDPTTREFGLLLARIHPLLDRKMVVFRFDEDASELTSFIRRNFVLGRARPAALAVTRNNFVFVYQKWVRDVKPSIAVDWDGAKKQGILDADFFLADLLSKKDSTLVEKLFVVLNHDHYDLDRRLDSAGFVDAKRAEFSDKRKSHDLFWNRYRRPPKREYWETIQNRRDLLVPQDVRERKGSYFTPQMWVEKAQDALAAVLGEDWQEHYNVWDCAAGTGNLLAGLQDKYKIWASTLDQTDVDVMHERIKHGATLLDRHVFRFDFLNDSFDRLPEGLRTIVEDPEKRKKLVVFINPPYAEAGSTRSKKSKTGVSNETIVHDSAAGPLAAFAKRELFAQFLARLYDEIPGCIIAEFSKLKHLNGPYFKPFRDGFLAKLLSGFVVPADTFDNVTGRFPIGFMIWDTSIKERFEKHSFTVFDRSGKELPSKEVLSYDGVSLLNDWMRPTWRSVEPEDAIGWIVCNGNDFQHQNEIVILSERSNQTSTFFKPITKTNFVMSCAYFSVRHCIDADWLNDRDQFLWPEDSWMDDGEFQFDCLAFTLFHGQNRISCKAGKNHWIPFSEDDVGAKDAYRSHFLVSFLRNPISKRSEPFSVPSQGLLFPESSGRLLAAELSAVYDATGGASHQVKSPQIDGDDMPHSNALQIQHNSCELFSPEAKAVYDAGRKLWRHYHAQPGALPDASFYDIRAHFQGFKPNGHMNAASSDATYTALVSTLRAAERTLAAKLAPKVREHGFLR